MGASRHAGVYKQIFSCFVVSLPLLMSGAALGWSSPMIQYLKDGSSPVYLTSAQESWMVTWLDIGNVVLSIPAGMLMDYIGRKLSVYLTVPLSLVGWLLVMTATRAWHLYAARFFHGSAMVISLVTTPIYVGELASASIRGSLVLMAELTYAVGLLLAYVVGWLTDYYALATVCATVPIATGVLMIFVPESPYYLMLAGKPAEAAASLRRLRDSDEAAFARELETVRLSATEENRHGQLTDLFNRDRVPLIIVLTLAVLQMVCGASVMEAYASSVMTDSTLSPNACAVIFGLFVVAACVPFTLAVDRYGRRPLYLASCAGTTVCHALVVAGLLLLQPTAAGVDDNTSWRLWCGWTLLAGLCGAVFFINIGLMPLLWVVQCEYFPSDTRGLANSAVVFVVTTASTIMLKVYQPVSDAYGKQANFVFYTVATFLGGLFCYFCVPETKGKSFVQIQTDFETYTWLRSRSCKKLGRRRASYARIP